MPFIDRPDDATRSVEDIRQELEAQIERDEAAWIRVMQAIEPFTVRAQQNGSISCPQRAEDQE